MTGLLVHANRLEGPVPDVQRDFRPFDAAGREFGEESLGQVESGSRCRNRTPVLGEDRLVALTIGVRIGPVNVGRQGHVPNRIHHLVDGLPSFGPEADRSSPMEVLLEHLDAELVRTRCEHGSSARVQLLSRVHQRLPPVIAQAANEQALHGPATRVAVAKQAGREDARVVDHQEVGGSQELREIADGRMGANGTRGSVEDEQSGGFAVGGRDLGNLLGRQREIELGNVHGDSVREKAYGLRRTAGG